MKIGIDITSAEKDKAGVGYFTFSMVEALTKTDTNNSYELFTNNPSASLNFNLPKNFKITVLEEKKAGTKWMLKGAQYLKQHNFDLFISPSNFLWSIIYPKTIQIVHDLAPLKYPQYFSKKGALFYKLQLGVALNKALYVITPCQTILEEVMQLNKKKNKDYIYLGVHDWALEKKDEDYYKFIKSKYQLPKRYFIYIGTLEPRKNHINAIRGFELFSKENSDVKLIIVGKQGWYYQQIFNEIEKLNLQDKVVFTGYAPEEDLAGLVDLSMGGIMTSFYEGFGLPIVEYIARQKHVVASDIPVFREISKDFPQVEFVNPNSPEEVKNALVKLLNKQELTEISNISKYSWQTFANKLIDKANTLGHQTI